MEFGIRLLKRSLGLLVGALLALATFTSPAASRGIGSVNVHIIMLRNDHGQVICTLFTPSDRFPDKSHKGMTIAVPIQGKHATCRFKDVPYGDYAIVAFHDENRDGEFNQNWLGMPKEGFGFSKNPGTLKKPVFGDAKFTVDQPAVDVTIKLNYWL
ncbi:MAG: DUF2141 domain-containing protein [Deltaproteobacteria bacterium]|nr:DUF2141 domain-containing protein [Deltaproteobacteria bacterium]